MRWDRMNSQNAQFQWGVGMTLPLDLKTCAMELLRNRRILTKG